jgi:hypothetical protein
LTGTRSSWPGNGNTVSGPFYGPVMAISRRPDSAALKFGEISSHIAERKCENIAASGADAVVLGDLGCMLNIEGRLRRRGDDKTQVLHVAEVLATDI